MNEIIPIPNPNPLWKTSFVNLFCILFIYLFYFSFVLLTKFEMQQLYNNLYTENIFFPFLNNITKFFLKINFFYYYYRTFYLNSYKWKCNFFLAFFINKWWYLIKPHRTSYKRVLIVWRKKCITNYLTNYTFNEISFSHEVTMQEGCA